MGNLRSVQNAIEQLDGQASIATSPEEILAAEKLILPGVGAFRDAMQALQDRQLIPAIKAFAESGRPFLGICLGMQLLFDVSEEFGTHQGLGILAGKSIRFQLPATFKVPHMGWNQISLSEKPNPLNEGIVDNDHFYFVHSYHVVPIDPSVIWMESDYGGPFCAAVQQGNIFATQFHPEKSQRPGLQLLRNFVHL